MNRRRSIALLASLFGLNLWSAAGIAQQDAPPPPIPKSAAEKEDEAKTKSVGNLTARYRLSEHYTNLAERAPIGAVGQFQVAFREIVSTEDASLSKSRTVQAIYSERPAEVSPVDERLVTDSIRHYTTVNITPDPMKGRKDLRPLSDLTVWYRDVAGDVPLVMVLNPGRSLREEEYRFAINYDFATKFGYLLPDTAVRIGDTWKVNRNGASALVNDEVRSGVLTGKLVEIRTHPRDAALNVAIISVSGRLVTGFDQSVRDTAVNARIEFVFNSLKPEDNVIDAPGAIDRLRLAQTGVLRATEGVPSRGVRRDLNFERRRPGEDPILAIPSPAPAPNPENSWLTFTDPQGRYSLRHPQGFQPAPTDQPNTFDLKYFHANSPDDVVRLTFVEKPEGRPEDTFELLISEWQKNKIEVQRGLSEKFPETEWPGLSVNHMEAALTSPGPTGAAIRRYFDGYVLQFPRNASLFVSATTFQDQPEDFRKEVREILKTAKLGALKAP